MGACGTREVARFDQRHTQTAQRTVARGEAAGCAAAYDQNVEYLAGKSGKGALHAREG
jgi:hypothetical protein